MSSADEDKRLEEMLRQAALLQDQMRGRSLREGSVNALSNEEQQGSVSQKAPPVDDMLRQAELLSQKMRSSRQQAFASAVEADDSDASVDDMLRKAELLSRQISPSRRRSAVESTTTPGLIRQSENILSNMYQDPRPAIEEMNTPELMRQTEHLLGKMRASSTSASRDGSHVENGSDVMSSQEALIAKMKADQRASLLAQKKKNGGEQDSTRSEELRRLMEQALSSWSGSGEQKGRVKDALEQIVPNLSSTADTPSTVSIQPPDGDEISSVGSLSPRSRKSTVRATSLLSTASRPPPPPSDYHDIDAAEEMVRNMALALQESRSGESQEINDEQVTLSPLRRPAEEDTDAQDDQPTPPKRNAQDRKPIVAPSVPSLSPSVPSLSNKRNDSSREAPTSAGRSSQKQTGSSRSNQRIAPRPRPPPPKETPPRQPSSSVSFTPNRTHRSSEEAQYNAIMAAIDSSGGRAVSWEKVESAGAQDEDYVPLADYSKQGGTRSLGVGTFDLPVMMGRSPRVRRRRRKIGRIIVTFLALIAAGYVGVRTWRSGGMYLDTEPTIVTKEPVYIEDPIPEPVVEEPVPVPEYSTTIVLRGPSPWARMRKKMAKVARRARRQLIRFVINLTPPWERFCSADAKTCRDTDYLLNWIGPH